MGSSSLMGLLKGFDFRFRGSWQSLWAGQKTAKSRNEQDQPRLILIGCEDGSLDSLPSRLSVE